MTVRPFINTVLGGVDVQGLGGRDAAIGYLQAAVPVHETTPILMGRAGPNDLNPVRVLGLRVRRKAV